MGMFSKELQELDRNTVSYMIDEMQEEINQQKVHWDMGVLSSQGIILWYRGAMESSSIFLFIIFFKSKDIFHCSIKDLGNIHSKF